MLYVPISCVKPGMVVAKPISQTRNRIFFAQRGLKLDSRTIKRLSELGIKSIWVECEGMEGVGERINDAVVEKRQELSGLLINTVESAGSQDNPKFKASVFQSKVGGLLDEIMDDPIHEPIVSGVAADCSNLVRHQTNCCYLCLLLGAHLSGYVRDQRKRLSGKVAEDIRELGIGAFIHDMGKAKLSERVQKISILSRNAKDPEYQSHVKVGSEMFRGEFSSLVMYMINHHHQRFDGKGFPSVQSREQGAGPAPLAGDKIHIFARILAVVDAFDHLLGPPQSPRPTIQALHVLREMQLQGWFDPIVVAALMRLIPPFMVGSVVTLSDGNKAVVIENHGEAPCSPIVRPVMSGEPGVPGVRMSAGIVNLAETNDVFVYKVNGVDVEPFFFSPLPISDGEMAFWGLRSKAVKAVQAAAAEI